MSAPDADGAVARPRSRFARFLASPLAIVIASVVTLALIASVIVAIWRWNTPAPVVALGEPMPVDFALELQAQSSPFVRRGEAVTLSISAMPSAPLARVELWADGDPYIVIDDPDLIPQPIAGRISLSLPYVPPVAGGHLVYVRAVDAAGHVSQSAPVGTPVLDQPADVGMAYVDGSEGTPPDSSFLSAPGDSLQTISNRMGLPIDKLHTFDSFPDPLAILPTGTRIVSAIPAAPPSKLTYPVVDLIRGITGKVVDCQVVITSTANRPVRLYGGSGNVYLGKVPAQQSTTLGNLPIGPVVITGLMDDQTTPLSPIALTLPDECATGGWKGDAVITGGLLLTDEPVETPYVYLAVDKGTWQRFPAAGTLNSGSVNDLRSYVELSAYDQLDLEVWTTDGITASKAAAGQFCRADMNRATPLASSSSGGECDPPGASPGAPGGGPVVGGFEITATASGGSSAVVTDFDPDDPENTVVVEGYGPIDVRTNAVALGYDQIRYQVSFNLLGQQSPQVSPAGMFTSVDVNAIYESTLHPTTIDPTKWANLSLQDLEQGKEELSLDDELARQQALQHFVDGKFLIDQFWIRAIATKTLPDGTYASREVATNSIHVFLPSLTGKTWPKITNPSVKLVAGLDQTATWSSSFYPETGWDQSIQSTGTHQSLAVGGVCQEVLTYPEPGTWNTYPTNGPHSRPGPTTNLSGAWLAGDYQGTPKQPGDVLISGGIDVFSDLSMALARYPTSEHVYCLDQNAQHNRENEAANAARENRKCSLGCVLTFFAYGVVQGFAVGGPWGALIGGLAGLSLGVLSAASPAFYADLKSLWDSIANVYNAVFTKVFEFVAAINFVCQGIGAAAGDEAQAGCNGAVQAAASAVITYYTGLPPRIATTAELKAAEDGELEGALTLIINGGLQALGVGVDCSTFTLDSTQASDLARKAAGEGADLGDQGTGLSGCALVARALTKQMRRALDQRQEDVMGAITGMSAIRGLNIAPFSDRVTQVSITAPATLADANLFTTCPAVVNTTVSEGGKSYRMRAQQVELRLLAGTPVADVTVGDPFWVAQFPVGVAPKTLWSEKPDQNVNFTELKYPQQYTYSYFDRSRLVEETKASPIDPYLQVRIDSPCFTKSYVLTAAKYSGGGLTGAFVHDTRKAVGYW